MVDNALRALTIKKAQKYSPQMKAFTMTARLSLRGETLFRRGNPVCFSRDCSLHVDRHRMRLRDDG